MGELREIASGLRFPEGPIAMNDGSVVLVEIARGTLSRVDVSSGAVDVVAECGGGPNGAAIGPDGAAYVCNNGGCFEWIEAGGMLFPGPPPASYPGRGSIQRVELATGTIEDLYLECDGRPLRAPNDLVFDAAGGFWFTDHGVREHRTSDRTGIYYARADGSSIREVIFPVDAPNGIGLAPDGERLYVAETHTGRVWAWPVSEPGVVVATNPVGPGGGELLCGLPGMQLLDSLAVDGDGWVCVATLVNGGITSIAPDGAIVEHLPTGDPITTNICFGGADLGTAFITCSASGRLVATDWARPGLQLAYTA
ncbi:MAG: SMP-30/gluconolactonase/LRE family protein [Acidimicrobiales bacterium]